MKTEEEIKKEINELEARITTRIKEIDEMFRENEDDQLRVNTLHWSLITTPCKTPYASPGNKTVGSGLLTSEQKNAVYNPASFAGDGPIPDEPIKKDCVSYGDEDGCGIKIPHKKKHNTFKEADDFDTESEINQFI
jgi:hypothetical protein